MSASLAPQWIIQALTDAGAVASGAKLYSFIAGGGSVPSPLLGEDGVTPLANPYTFNSAGRAKFLLDDAVSYRLRLETATGALIEERDNVFSAKSAFNGWVRATDLADGVNPANGAGMVGYDGRPEDTLKKVLDRHRAHTVSILEWVPAAQHSAILAGTSTWDAAEAFTDANADSALRLGMNVEIPGALAIATETSWTKPDICFIGGGVGLDGQGAKIRRRANVTAFKIGNEADEGPFINAPTWERIRFESFNSGALWDADFFKINATIMGGFFHCIFDGDHLGAWLSLRRMQDMWFAWNTFRGGGHDAGDKAQIYFDEPQDLYGPGHVFLEKFWCNALRFHNNHHEWGINIGGTYTDRVTGLTASGNRGVVCFKNKDTYTGGPGSLNLIRVSDSKMEPTTSRGWNGEDTRIAAIQFNKCAQMQFLGNWYNQTKFWFDVRSAEGFKVTGTYNNTAVPEANERRLFSRFRSSESVNLEVAGYGLPGSDFANCPGYSQDLRSNVNYSGARRDTVMAKEAWGAPWMQRLMSTQTPGLTFVEDPRANGGTAIRSQELTTGTYGQSLLTVVPTVRDDVPHGLTFRFKACTEATPAGNALLQVAYSYFPRDQVYDADGITVDWPVARYFPQDTETGYTTIEPVTAWKRDRKTGAETALTISGKTGDDGNPNGGIVTVTEAVNGTTHQVVIRRASMTKSILVAPIGSTLTTVPTWYSVIIPPGVMALENVQISLRSGFEEAGLRVRILDYDFLNYAEMTTQPYYPTSIATAGGGLIPGGNGWRVGARVTSFNAIASGCLGWVCTDPTGGSGAGTWRPVSAEDPTTVYTGAGGTVSLPALSGFFAVGTRRTYINAGTGDLVVQRAGSDAFLGSTATSFTIGIGEAVDFEHVTATVWAIRSGVRCVGAISYTGAAVTQLIPASTFTKLTTFDTNRASANLTTDQTNDKLTTVREGWYEFDAMIGCYVGTAADLVLGIYSGGAILGISTPRKFDVTGPTQGRFITAQASGWIAAGTDIDLRLFQNDASANSVSLNRAILSAKRIA